MRLGTRGSALALAQAGLVADQLEGAELITVSTSGDRGEGVQDKSRWVDAIEDALLAGEIDLAVHSAKDLPMQLAEGLELLGGPARSAPEDVLCGAAGLDRLPLGSTIGTSSLRRTAQLRSVREDLEVVALSGNVDTRLRKLADDRVDAIVLARAGLLRLGRDAETDAPLDPAVFVPAPGQGMLALEARSGEQRVRAAVAAVVDRESCACLLAERALARELGASCNTPLGAHARRDGSDGLLLAAWVGLPDGSAWVRDELTGALEQPQSVGRRVAERMRAAGAGELLARAEEIATSAQRSVA